MILKMYKSLGVVIAAAGKGSRTGLDYPKTLYQIKNKPILIHLIQNLSKYDSEPSVIVSPKGQALIGSCLETYGFQAELITQDAPLGMGDAVLQFKRSKNFRLVEDIILAWGDIPFLQPATIDALLMHHREDDNALSFATTFVEHAYTRVLRDGQGKVQALHETRELGDSEVTSGERDIGLFIFKKEIIFSILEQEHPNKYGKSTHEHGFLYIIELLAKLGYRIGAYPVASSLDLISFNKMDDIKAWI